MQFTDRLKHAWNAFRNKEPTRGNYGSTTSYRVDRPRMTRGNERSIVSSIINRIAVDVEMISIEHAKLDQNGRYAETKQSSLNYCLTVEANIDQTARAFKRSAVIQMLDEGVIVIVPTRTNKNPMLTASFDVEEMRIGKVTRWYPRWVTVNLYNDETGVREDITLPKTMVSIVENPFYSTMNEPSSTMQRLIRKLNMLDAVDEQSSSGKLDLIIQLPYIIKSQARKDQAEQRRKEIEMQLAGSKYGIAYTDGTEHITQLNRSVENNLLSQIQYLTTMLYSQLGMPETVFNGTADEQTMLNYNNRTIEPIISALVDEMNRKFLSKTARTQGQAIVFFKDPFRLVPVAQLAEIADKFTRNEILSSNEFRQIVGYKPVEDPKADELRNKNLNEQADVESASTTEENPEMEVKE